MRYAGVYRRWLLLGLTAPMWVVVLRSRSLWLDEAALGYSVVSRSYAQLLLPLEYNQVAPIGYLLFAKIGNSLFGCGSSFSSASSATYEPGTTSPWRRPNCRSCPIWCFRVFASIPSTEDG